MLNNQPDIDVGHEVGEGQVTAGWRVRRNGATGGMKGSEAAHKKSARRSLMEEKGGKGGAGGAKSDIAGRVRKHWSLHEEESQSFGVWDERRQVEVRSSSSAVASDFAVDSHCDLLSIFEYKIFIHLLVSM